MNNIFKIFLFIAFPQVGFYANSNLNPSINTSREKFLNNWRQEEITDAE
jgi:hypothetical protein